MKRRKIIAVFAALIISTGVFAACDITPFGSNTPLGGDVPSNPVVSARFYCLQEAYDLELLTFLDLAEISFHNNGDWLGMPTAEFREPLPKTPEVLSEETENKIKQTFLDEFISEYYSQFNIGDNPEVLPDYTIDDITIANYCGTYNGAVAVMMDGLYGYAQALTSETVAAITFRYGDANKLRVWIEQEKPSEDKVIPFTVGLIENKMGSLINYESTTAILKAPFSCEGDLMEGFGFYLDYDEAFFAQKSLVVYIFSATSTGGNLEVMRLSIKGEKLVMNIYLEPGMDAALSYWTVVLEVDKADANNLDKVEIKLL